MPEIFKRRMHDDEVVEDSEPERESKRQKKVEARKKKCPSLHLQQADQLDRVADTECNPCAPVLATVGAQSQVDKSLSGEPISLVLSRGTHSSSATSCSSLTKLPSSTELERTDVLVVDMPRPSLAAGECCASHYFFAV
jgi:hypothetical protein